MKNNSGKRKGAESKKSLHIPHIRHINITYGVAFALLCLWFTAMWGANYLQKVELQSIFLSTKQYFNDCMHLPGGMLTWISTYLTQLFYHPWLGGIVYTLILSAIPMLCIAATGAPRKTYPIAIGISATALLAFFNMGYIIYSLKTPGFAFLLPVGIIAALSMYFSYRRSSSWILQVIMVIVIALAGYCLIGFYGLLATGLCCVAACTKIITGSGKERWQMAIVAILGIASIIIVPKAWFTIYGGDLPIVQIYRCPLPILFPDESNLMIPYYVAFALMGILAIWGTGASTRQLSRGANVTCKLAGLLSIAALLIFRYDDPNFRIHLALDHAMEQEDWQGMLDIIEANQQTDPTRLNVMYSNIAMIRAGVAPDNMFRIRIGSADYNTSRALRLTHEAGSTKLAYHLGMINYAYRWAMEYKVEYGLRVEQLQMMVKASLLNGDYAVARKCLDALDNTMFHKSWAKKYREYADNPDLISQDPEMSQIAELMRDDNEFIEDKGTLEGYIWKNLSTVKSGSLKLLELSMLSALICRELNSFGEAFPTYYHYNKQVPRSFQEGIVMWAFINDIKDYKQFGVDDQTIMKFNQFINAMNMYNKMPEDKQREMMEPTFGDTYWYYAYYQDNLAII